MPALSIVPSADAIDARWLSAALAPRHPGVRVARVEVVERHRATNAHARLRVDYDEAAGAPPTLFCKLLPEEPAARDAIVRTGMGLREAFFYEQLAGQVALRVPRVHAVRADPRSGAFALLLEDLHTSGCGISDGTRGVPVDSAAVALEELAALHVHFEDAARRARQAPWLREPDPPGDYGVIRLRQALAQHRERLSPAFAGIAALYVERQQALHAAWHPGTGPPTLIHGDAHIGNLFDDAGRTGFLDWGIVQRSTPLRDVSYFLIMALDVEARRAHERALLRHYLDARRAIGGASIGFDEAWAEHRVQAAYVVPACCQVVTLPEGAAERRRIFAEAFLARAEAALDDLEVRAALRERAGL